MQSQFFHDKQLEEWFGRWLDQNFYPRLLKDDGTVKIDRVTDESLQKLGVDVKIMVFGQRTLYIDEKSTLHYINKDIPTFAFELLNRTSQVRGWLFNKDYITTDYVLCWPRAKTDYVTCPSDFTSCELMIVNRYDLIKYLSSVGLSEDKVYKMVDSYLPKDILNSNRVVVAEGIKLFYTQNLREKPVNLVISKNVLSKVAKIHITVTSKDLN